MGEVLFLAHRIPFPPDRGDKIRSHHVLRAIARHAPVHVACFADDAFDFDEEFELSSLAASYRLVQRSRPLALAGVQAVFSGKPVSLTAFRDPALVDYVAEVLRTRPISAIYVFSGQMGQYVPAGFTGRVVMDFVDVDSAKFDAYARSGSGLMKWVNAREGYRLRNEEARLAARADCSLLISDAEAALLRSRLSADELADADIRVVPNGIDSVSFDPARVAAEPAMLACTGPRLIFSGQMDYAPNDAAVRRVIERIMPLVRRALPEATFHVVGRNPAADLAPLAGEGGCHVWGRVDDMRCWLKAADLALVPLEIARGVQNKVLEAMSMALPVVLTSGAATGIGARDGTQMLVADSDEALAEAVIALLRDRQRASAMGSAARRFVCEQASWQAALATLPGLLGLNCPRERDAA